jgi:putative flippase GtrA
MKKLILNERETAYQFLKFSLIGFLNTVIHYGIFIILFRYATVHYLVSSVIGYVAGLINSFILNKKWTFRTKGVRKDVEFTKFCLVNLAALLANLGSLGFFVSYMNIIPELGQLLAIIFSLTVNFLGNKFWTFRQGFELPL